MPLYTSFLQIGRRPSRNPHAGSYFLAFTCFRRAQSCQDNHSSVFLKYFSDTVPTISRERERTAEQSCEPENIRRLTTVRENGNEGVLIDYRGRLKVIKSEHSSAKYPTALVLNRASPSLSKQDFLKVLRGHRNNTESGSRGEFEAVIPIRHPRSYQRSNSWILLFSSPTLAEKFQKLAIESHSTRPRKPRKHSPMSLATQEQPFRINPPSNILTTPDQNLILVARMSPFDGPIRHALATHDKLTGSHHAEKSPYAVRVCFTFPNNGRLDAATVRNFLHIDGIARGSPWVLSESGDAVSPVEGALDTQAAVKSDVSKPIFREQEHCLTVKDVDNWRLRFQAASDAKRFVRLWHRRTMPSMKGVPEGTMIGAECLF